MALMSILSLPFTLSFGATQGFSYKPSNLVSIRLEKRRGEKRRRGKGRKEMRKRKRERKIEGKRERENKMERKGSIYSHQNTQVRKGKRIRIKQKQEK